MFGWPSLVGGGWLPVQASGPVTVLPETTKGVDPVTLSVRNTGPVTWLPVSTTCVVPARRNTGPTTTDAYISTRAASCVDTGPITVVPLAWRLAFAATVTGPVTMDP